MTVQKKFILGTGILVFLVVVLSGGIVFPTIQSIMGRSQAVLQEKQMLAQFRADKESIADFIRARRIYETELGKVDSLFANPQTPITYIESLEAAAADTNFVLNISPGNPKRIRGEQWPSMDFRLASEGEYSDFLVFLQLLENSSYLMEIKNVSVDRVQQIQGEEKKEEVKFSVLVKVYTSALPQIK
tara:strand:+ start:852 stop:1412 length:561 start_codon:yes stop_codon:yes gene_type:complete